ncbi:MAG: hypothetical protein WC545_03730 [Patescibacteria group bacterium]|jgi:hypothetical protein
MAPRNSKNQNALNAFLNEYFNAILAVILILFLAAAYFLFLGPKFQATKAAIERNMEEQQLLYENQQKKLNNLKSILELYKKINSGDLQRFNSVLPDEYVPEKLFGELEEVIGRAGWLLTNVRIGDPGPAYKPLSGGEADLAAAFKDKKITSLELELSIGAVDYAGLKRLLRLLENNLRLFDIIRVDFSPSTESAAIVIRTYYYKTTPNAIEAPAEEK